MNAKELIEAATRLRERHGEWRYVEGDSSYFKDVIASCDHILATVRPDDDEPVTRERLEADGMVKHFKWDSWSPDWDRSPMPLQVFSREGEWVYRIGVADSKLKSMGHLRRLVATLGET